MRSTELEITVAGVKTPPPRPPGFSVRGGGSVHRLK